MKTTAKGTDLRFRTRDGHAGRTYRADGAEFSYTIARAPKGWKVTVWTQDVIDGTVFLGAERESIIADTAFLGRSTARQYEANLDADHPTKRAQSRMTRAINRAYEGEGY